MALNVDALREGPQFGVAREERMLGPACVSERKAIREGQFWMLPLRSLRKANVLGLEAHDLKAQCLEQLAARCGELAVVKKIGHGEGKRGTKGNLIQPAPFEVDQY